MRRVIIKRLTEEGLMLDWAIELKEVIDNKMVSDLDNANVLFFE
jgi:hypothetical protein